MSPQATPEVASFTFHELHALTPELTGPQRMDVFSRLPGSLQWLAWRQLRERMDFIGQREMEEIEP